MSKFEGTVDSIVFRNDANGWTVASIRLDGSRDSISAVGVMPFLSAGEHAVFDGELVEHRDYGRQIKVTGYETTRPETRSGVEKYLGSGLVKGVGPATAKQIVEYFGARALDVLEAEPERLTEVPGIGQIGCAGLELDAIDVEPEFVGCDLGQRRPGALPHVVRADLHDA